jgi:hypothetical protein
MGKIAAPAPRMFGHVDTKQIYKTCVRHGVTGSQRESIIVLLKWTGPLLFFTSSAPRQPEPPTNALSGKF